MSESQQKLECIHAYHELSKHRQGKYAPGPDSLDWDMQPDPFREYRQCARISLPLTAKQLIHTVDDMLTPGAIASKAFSKNSIGQLLELSMGLSAWKVYGSDRWALRCNPSSGNLHPTETYIVTSTIDDLVAGVYHYHSHDHCLEQRCRLRTDSNAQAAILPEACFLIGLSSIHWRESWKYGVRAYRYCQLDIGHAIASIRYAAALQGWHVRVIDHVSDAQIAQILGIDRQQDYVNSEQETADVLMLIDRSGTTDVSMLDIANLSDSVQTGFWKGSANILSPQGRLTWPEIDKVSEACHKPITKPVTARVRSMETDIPAHVDINASQLLRQRRSAQAFDGQSILPADDFLHIVSAVLPSDKQPPLDCVEHSPNIHLVFYIHRVDGLVPGLYALPRTEAGMTLMQTHFRDQFIWQRPEICPQDIPLHLLVRANCRNAARTVSCHQDIAADGAFAVSLLAEFDSVLSAAPWKYRMLYHEAGMVGQTLYIEAEAVGCRGTGIGCFFDDDIHQTLGINNQALQCLYNFTIGMPIVDSRVISLPPYSHLQQSS